MTKKPRLNVVDESSTGLNRKFEDTATGDILSRGKVADKIEQGQYPGYHIMNKGGKRIPRSNPDKSKDNNLG